MHQMRISTNDALAEQVGKMATIPKSDQYLKTSTNYMSEQ
jgi:hypothetical protein